MKDAKSSGALVNKHKKRIKNGFDVSYYSNLSNPTNLTQSLNGAFILILSWWNI